MCKECFSTVAMIEDDLGRLRNFVAYCKARKDIKPQASQFAGDLRLLAQGTDDRERVDLFLLDVRLPQLTHDLQRTPPGQRPARGVNLAAFLRDHPTTSSIPVVVYTQFGDDPEIRQELNSLSNRSEFPNVVRVLRTRPTVRETIRTGLVHVRHVDLDVVAARGHDAAFELVPRGNEGRGAIASARILLNGWAPDIVTEIAADRVWVGFGGRARHELDDNYLMIEVGDRKSVFVV